MATLSNGKKQQKITHLGDLLVDTLAYSSSWGSWQTVLSLSFRSMRTRRRFQYNVYGDRDRGHPPRPHPASSLWPGSTPILVETRPFFVATYVQ